MHCRRESDADFTQLPLFLNVAWLLVANAGLWGREQQVPKRSTNCSYAWKGAGDTIEFRLSPPCGYRLSPALLRFSGIRPIAQGQIVMCAKKSEAANRLRGAVIFITIVWLTFSDNLVVRFARIAVEPTACLLFPVNILFLPVIYLAAIFLYVSSASGEKMNFGSIVKRSFAEMFKGAISTGSSQAVASTVIMVVLMLSYWCRFPVISH